MDIIVVGAGIMGLSAARALLKTGHHVRVVDKGPIPNPSSSSYDEHRLIRHPYGDKAGYAAMIDDAYTAWEDLWRDLGHRHYHQTGTLVLSRSRSGWAADSLEILDRMEIAYERLSPAAMHARFPPLVSNDIALAGFLPTGGILRASAILHDLARYLGAHGTVLLPETPIAMIDFDRPMVQTTQGAVMTADLLVIATGAWTPRLMGGTSLSLRPSRQLVVYATPPEDERAWWEDAPMLLDIDAGAGFYLVPPAGGCRLKIGDHRFTLTGDPDAPREASEQEIAAVMATARSRLRSFDRFGIDEGRVCFYTVAPDERFLIVRQANTWVMAGFSGHGFKFGPLMGERLAQAIDGALSEGELQRWAAGRDEGQRVKSKRQK